MLRAPGRTVVRCVKLTPSVDWRIAKDVTLLESAVQARFTWAELAAVAVRLVGAGGARVALTTGVGGVFPLLFVAVIW